MEIEEWSVIRMGCVVTAVLHRPVVSLRALSQQQARSKMTVRLSVMRPRREHPRSFAQVAVQRFAAIEEVSVVRAQQLPVLATEHHLRLGDRRIRLLRVEVGDLRDPLHSSLRGRRPFSE